MPSASTVSEIFEYALGERPDSIECWLTDNHQVYRLIHGQQKYYLKFASIENAQELKFEYRANRFLEACSLPCPWVVASSFRARQRIVEQFEWLLVEHSGESLALHVKGNDQLLIESGRLLAKYHGATDSLSEQKLALLPAPVFNLATRIERWLIRAERLCDVGQLEKHVVEQLWARLAHVRPEGKSVLCHGEFSIPHVMVDRGRVTTAIDWAYLEHLPAVFDLCQFENQCRWLNVNFDAFLDGYGMDVRTYLDDPNRSTYRLVHALRQLDPARKTFAENVALVEQLLVGELHAVA